MEDQKQKETVGDGLHLSPIWVDNNGTWISNAISSHESVSSILEEMGVNIKVESFGLLKKGNLNMTEYERKLLFAGYQLADKLQSQRPSPFLFSNPNNSGLNGGNPSSDSFANFLIALIKAKEAKNKNNDDTKND